LIVVAERGDMKTVMDLIFQKDAHKLQYIQKEYGIDRAIAPSKWKHSLCVACMHALLIVVAERGDMKTVMDLIFQKEAYKLQYI
jgi:hypothetical protein